jgi:hypothetical protein
MTVSSSIRVNPRRFVGLPHRKQLQTRLQNSEGIGRGFTGLDYFTSVDRIQRSRDVSA